MVKRKRGCRQNKDTLGVMHNILLATSDVYHSYFHRRCIHVGCCKTDIMSQEHQPRLASTKWYTSKCIQCNVDSVRISALQNATCVRGLGLCLERYKIEAVAHLGWGLLGFGFLPTTTGINLFRAI